MITVRETRAGAFERIGGNPTLTSLDGKVKAPLRTIMAPSWTEGDRAKFGVYVVMPFAVPEGMAPVGSPAYIKDAGGKIVETYAVEPTPALQPSPYDVLRTDVDALIARVATLEGKQ